MDSKKIVFELRSEIKKTKKDISSFKFAKKTKHV